MQEQFRLAARHLSMSHIPLSLRAALVFTGVLLALAACGAAAPGASPPGADTTPARSDAQEQGGAAPASDQSPAAPGDYNDIPQSTTPEGYHVLGRADAPALIQHYSDFL